MSPLVRIALVAAIAAVTAAPPLLHDAEARVAAPLRAPRLRQRLLADLVAREVDFDRDGTPEPAGDLTPDGTIDGRPARVVLLVVPPRDSADMYSVTGYVDRRGRRYWAVRTGGFWASVKWVGPFALPRLLRASR